MRSRSCISKVEKERLLLTTPASGMKALAQIGAWHNSLDRMPTVISSVKLLLRRLLKEHELYLKQSWATGCNFEINFFHFALFLFQNEQLSRGNSYLGMITGGNIFEVFFIYFQKKKLFFNLKSN